MTELFQHSTEEYVYRLCKRSFLSPWSHANPRGTRAGTELCDVLVVCEPDVAIVSVKASRLGVDPNMHAIERWRRRVIDKSVPQLYGAARALKGMEHVVRRDGTPGIALPRLADRRIHLLSICFGESTRVPLQFGDYGKGFIHVFDETAFEIIAEELNTAADFFDYLSAKEASVPFRRQVVARDGEEHLLARYIRDNRTFPTGIPLELPLSRDWPEFQLSDAYRARREDDRPSYAWDRLIEYVAREAMPDAAEPAFAPADLERALRAMARERRFARRLLGTAFLQFLERAKRAEISARVCSSPSGVLYVFVDLKPVDDRSARIAELGTRCLVARARCPEAQTVVGIGTNLTRARQGHATDIYVLDRVTWTPELAEGAERMARDLGYWTEPEIESRSHDEFRLPLEGASGHRKKKP